MNAGFRNAGPVGLWICGLKRDACGGRGRSCGFNGEPRGVPGKVNGLELLPVGFAGELKDAIRKGARSVSMVIILRECGDSEDSFPFAGKLEIEGILTPRKRGNGAEIGACAIAVGVVWREENVQVGCFCENFANGLDRSMTGWFWYSQSISPS